MPEFPPRHPPTESLHPETITVRPPSPRSSARWLLGLIPVGGAIAVAIVRLVPAASGDVEVPSVRQAAHFPILCTRGASVSIRDVTHTGTGTLINAEGGCHVLIQNSQLASDVVVSAGDGADIRVEGSRLTARQEAIRTQDRATLTLSDSTVDGQVSGLRLGSSSLVNTTHTQITSAGTAIYATDGLKLVGSELTLTAKHFALEAGSSLRVTLGKCRISSDDTAVHAGFDADISLSEGCQIDAGQSALVAGAHLAMTLLASTLHAREDVVVAGTNATLQLSHAELSGAKRGLVADGNLTLTMDSSTLRASAIALCSGLNTRLNARFSNIGAFEALRLQAKPAPFVLENTPLSGSSVFDGRGCSAGTAAVPSAPLSRNAPAAELVEARAAVPEFDYRRAAAELDRAMRMATTMCHANAGRSKVAVVIPGFAPDGSNGGATVKNASEVGTATECVLHFFRRVQVPRFDPSEKPKEMLRVVALKD